ncbi:MAG: VPLPA-CTERM sorting domain-containing protein [Pseudomonadota bacterium]
MNRKLTSSSTLILVLSVYSAYLSATPVDYFASLEGTFSAGSGPGGGTGIESYSTSGPVPFDNQPDSFFDSGTVAGNNATITEMLTVSAGPVPGTDIELLEFWIAADPLLFNETLLVDVPVRLEINGLYWDPEMPLGGVDVRDVYGSVDGTGVVNFIANGIDQPGSSWSHSGKGRAADPLNFVFLLDSQQFNDFSLDGLHVEIEITKASPVPVPAAAWLFGSGLLGLTGIARRMNTRSGIQTRS